MVSRGSLVRRSVIRRSVTGSNRPKIKKIHPLIVMGGQRFFQEPDGWGQSLLQAGVAVLVTGCILRCDLGWRWRDRIAHQSVVTQPTLSNHEAGQHRSARNLRKQERAKRKGSRLRKKRDVGTVTLVNAVSLHGHDLVPTQRL